MDNSLVWGNVTFDGKPAMTLTMYNGTVYTFVYERDYYITVYRTVHVPYAVTECYGSRVIESKRKPSILDLVYIQTMIYHTDKRAGRVSGYWHGV
jgi:hypothetical protein